MSIRTPEQVVQQLASLGVRLRCEGNDLRFTAPAGVFTPEWRAEVGRHKPDILVLLRAEAAREAAARAPIERCPEGEPRPLSFVQERLWVLNELEAGTGASNVSEGWRFRGEFDPVACEAGLRLLMARHEILRTRYGFVEDRLVQVAEETVELPLVRLDMSSWPEPQRTDRLREAAAQAWKAPFDLRVAPLWRVVLATLASDDHALVFAWHHSIYDTWSAAVFSQELRAAYEAARAGGTASFSALPIQYGDFARWQRGYLQGPLLEQQLAYWRRALAGEPAILQLPVDRPRPPVQTYEGALRARVYSRALCERLRELSGRAGVTMFMTTLAAFTALLSRYTRQTDITVGSPIANRDRPEVQGLFGCFLNTLVLRTDVSGDPSFLELLRRVRSSVLGAFDHQDLPFEHLVAEVQPERDFSRHPLFQVLFVHETRREEGLSLPGVRTERLDPDHRISRFDLSLYVYEGAGGLEAIAEFNTGLFETDTIERLLANFEVFLEGLVDRPERAVSELPLLTAEERQLVLERWNATGREYPRGSTLPELWAKQVARTPQAPAVRFERQVLTYAEVDQRSELLARHLRSLGVRPGTLVGVFLVRSPEMVSALLAIWRAGGAYVPLDPAYPAERLAHMIQDSGMRWVVTHSDIAARLPSSEATPVCLDRLPEGVPVLPLKEGAAQPEDRAYVIYTSGSTGKPKGVPISHRSLINFLVAMRHEPGLDERDVVLGLTTLSFDIAGLELWLPLTVGAQVAVVPSEAIADAVRLAEYVRDYGVTLMQATPATWRMLVDGGWAGDRRLRILCGGEALTRELADALIERCAELWNMYGPTETTVWSTVRRIERDGPIGLGRPIANTQLYVLDERREPVPVGVPGELFIGGDGVSPGYLNRPELTAERFVADPFSAQPGRRLYRTGDLVRYRGDGELEFLGRTDFQVKIRGYRIELGEIDAAMSKHPQVREAITVAREDTPGNRRLVGYYRSDAGTSVTPQALREHLRASLPEYMVPSAFVPLVEFPKTPNGKIDRRALPAPERDSGAPPGEFEPPTTEVEVRLAKIWGETLGVERVGRRDHFFESGGHSLLAVKLFARIEREFGRRLPLATLFGAPTLAGLARELSGETTPTATWKLVVPIQAHGTRMPFFCVHGAGGNVLLYRELSRRLGKDYPFFGIQCSGLDGESAYLNTVEEMAERYLAEIRAYRPQGPYCIGGYCMGGLVAYEIAVRLQSQNQEVALLALFDTHNHAVAAPPSSGLHRLRDFAQKLVFHWTNLLGVGMGGRRTYLQEKLRMAREAFGASLRARQRRWGSFWRGESEGTAPHVPLEKINDHAAVVYRPPPYPGVVTVFKPRRNYNRFADTRRGWGDLALGGLREIELPLNPHAMLVEPYVAKLADELRVLLDGIARDHGARSGRTR